MSKKQKQPTFKEDIDRYFERSLSRYSDLKVCHHTPILLQEIGMPDLPVFYTQKHLKYAIQNKAQSCHSHGLSLDLMYRMEEKLADPVMIIDSLSRPDSICVILDDFDLDGYPLFAALCPAVNGNHVENGKLKHNLQGNRLLSVYGREHIMNFLTRAVQEDKILYANKEKSQGLFSLLRQPFPQGFYNLDFGCIIQQSQNIVKKNQEQDLEIEWD